MKAVCTHATKKCIADKCYHATPHELEHGIGKSCQQSQCNGTKIGPDKSSLVKCIPVETNG